MPVNGQPFCAMIKVGPGGGVRGAWRPKDHSLLYHSASGAPKLLVSGMGPDGDFPGGVQASAITSLRSAAPRLANQAIPPPYGTVLN